MRSWRSELVSVAAVLAIPAGIALVFPYDALCFRAAPEKPADPAVAFVRLSPESERLAMRAARTSWRVKGGAREMRADLSVAPLPDDGRHPVLSSASRRAAGPAVSLVECGRIPFLPSCRAERPARIPDGKDVVSKPPFSREELLKLN